MVIHMVLMVPAVGFSRCMTSSSTASPNPTNNGLDRGQRDAGRFGDLRHGVVCRAAHFPYHVVTLLADLVEGFHSSTHAVRRFTKVIKILHAVTLPAMRLPGKP
jgi:hypothetical protein